MGFMRTDKSVREKCKVVLSPSTTLAAVLVGFLKKETKLMVEIFRKKYDNKNSMDSPKTHLRDERNIK